MTELPHTLSQERSCRIRTVTVRVLVVDALWYVAAGSELIRHVVVPRLSRPQERDDVSVSTDPKLSAPAIIESFARRWSLEVTLHEAKGKLGFENPQNRNERAVERSAPMAFIAHTLVLVRYVLHGRGSAVLAKAHPFGYREGATRRATGESQNAELGGRVFLKRLAIGSARRAASADAAPVTVAVRISA